MSGSDFAIQRKVFLHYWNNGFRNAKKISSETKIPLRTVERYMQKLRETGSIEPKRIKGRPKKINAVESHTMGQWVRRNNRTSVRSIASKLESKFGKKVSHMTVFRHLRNQSYQSTVPAPTPMITEKQRQARLEWAHRHLKDDWSKTIFTNEMAFCLFRNTVRMWCKSGSRPVRKLPKNQQKVMAWGGFSVRGRTPLCAFTTIMDSDFYIRILEEHLLPTASQWFGSRWRLVQDNDPKHKSKKTLEFFNRQHFLVLDWPSNSPDLNPIENLWNIVKNNVEKRRPQNINELKQMMVEEWNAIPTKILKNLAMSMTTRCKLCIEAKGERIKY